MRAYVFILTFTVGIAAVAAQPRLPQDRDEARTHPATSRQTR
jgi:hypothetical protein